MGSGVVVEVVEVVVVVVVVEVVAGCGSGIGYSGQWTAAVDASGAAVWQWLW